MKSPFSERSLIIDNGLVELTDADGQTQCFHVSEFLRAKSTKCGETVIQLRGEIEIRCHFSFELVKSALNLAVSTRKGGAK